jgi:hypothetical protein
MLIGVKWVKKGYAHPVTYKGGIVFSLFNQDEFSLWHTNYSISSKTAFGLDYIRMGHQSPTSLGLLRTNFLIKRWLSKGKQGNVYLLSGMGFKVTEDRLLSSMKPDPVALLGAQIDFETQRFYTAMMSRWISNQTLASEQVIHHTMFRAGFAPYISHTNELQTWLVAQLSYHTHMSNLPSVTMLIRAFHRTSLWEVGADTQGRPWLHLMTHF